jgi:hypothetical protein
MGVIQYVGESRDGDGCLMLVKEQMGQMVNYVSWLKDRW